MANKTTLLKKISRLFSLSGISLLVIVGAILFTKQIVSARSSETKDLQTSPLHPTFPLLDDDGENVLESGKPVSTMITCGDCHDTDFIAEHSYHVSVGLNDLSSPGRTITERPGSLEIRIWPSPPPGLSE